jgi:hypothetical protein
MHRKSVPNRSAHDEPETSGRVRHREWQSGFLKKPGGQAKFLASNSLADNNSPCACLLARGSEGRLPSKSWTVETKVCGLTGLVKYALAPDSNPARRLNSLARPVRMTTGIAEVPASLRKVSHTANHSSPWQWKIPQL